MSFANEQISQEDATKYGIQAIDQQFFVGATNSRSWTIDREREIYLRNVTNGREEHRSESGWTLFWHGELVFVELKLLELAGPQGGTRSAHWKLLRLELPTHFVDHSAEILADLKEALVAYKDGGVFSKATGFSVTLDM